MSKEHDSGMSRDDMMVLIRELGDQNREAVLALAQSLASSAPKTLLEMSGMSKEKQAALVEPNPSKMWREVRVRCDNGNVNVAHVESHPRHPHGVVVSWASVTDPPGMFTPQAQGGLVPDDFPVMRNGGYPQDGKCPRIEDMNIHFLQTRWQLHKADIERFIGKPLRLGDLVDPADIDAPWIESKAFAA